MQNYSLSVKGHPFPWTAYLRRSQKSDSRLNMEAYQASIQAAWINAFGREPYTKDPVRLTFAFHVDKYRGDLTNYQKAAEDALQGLPFVNDKQVEDIWSMICHCVRPHAEESTMIMVEIMEALTS